MYSNNPFLQPSPEPDPSSRWPDLSSEASSHGSYSPQPQLSSPSWTQSWQQPHLQPQPTGFQPQSSFGQQLQAQQQYPQYTGYPTSPQPQPQQPQFLQPLQTGYQDPNLTQFDPYANQNQWQQTPHSPTTYPQGQQYFPSQPSPSKNTHPRDYIRSHKAELDQWDSYTWRQALNAFDSLQAAWEERARVLRSSLSPYGAPHQMQQTQQMIKEAEHSVDVVAAAKIQMQEVFQGYKLSSDLASKNRVREGLNAGLIELPDYPQ